MIKTWKITEIECRNTLARPKIYNFETWICEYLYGEGSLDSQNCFCEADILDVVYRSIVHYKRYVCTRQIRHLYSVIDVLLFSDKLSNFESTQFWQCYDHEILPNNLILAIKSNENNLWKNIYNLYYGGTHSRKKKIKSKRYFEMPQYQTSKYWFRQRWCQIKNLYKFCEVYSSQSLIQNRVGS